MEKRTSLFAAVTVALGLVFGAGAALAQTVTIENGNVIRIEDLPIPDQAGLLTDYDVEFVFDTGSNVYPSGLADFPFVSEADALLAISTINETLNLQQPVPTGASSQGTDQYFNGIQTEAFLIGAVGGENIAGTWSECQADCFAGTAVLDSRDRYTYAVFTLADGSGPEQPPIADAGEDFSVVDTDGDGSEAVVLDGSGSSDPDGSIASYEWRLDGQLLVKGKTPTVNLEVGQHAITLKVTDDAGKTDQDDVTVTVFPRPPGGGAGLDLAAVPNGAGGGSPLTATQLLDLEAASQIVALRNAATGDIPFGTEAGLSYGAARSIALVTVPDINADGGDELAVLLDGLCCTLSARLQSSGAFRMVSEVPFPEAYRPVTMTLVPDAATGPALAVLGVRDDGNVKVTVKDAATASLVSSVSFAPGFPPEFMETVPDVTGNAVSELAVLGIDASGNIRVQLKDAATGTLIRWIQYAKAFTPLDMVVFATPQGPAIGVLQTHPDGRVRVQIKYAGTGQPVGSGAVNFAQSFAPLAVVAVPDTTGNGADELGVLGVRDDDTVRVQVKDALTKAQTAQVFFAKTFPPEDIVVLDDANGNGSPELAVLGVNIAGNARVQVKDAVTGTELSTAFVP